MLDSRKYTCLRYYNLINEPHGSWSNITWDEWYAAITNLQHEFRRRGLLDRITIAAPDGDPDFTKRCLEVPELRELTAIYDEHWYVWNEQIVTGRLGPFTREHLKLIREKDPGKQYILGEIGILDGKNQNDQQLNVYNFWYGVSMADAAIQMISGGMSGFIAWDLDDSMHFWRDGGESMNALSDTLPPNAYDVRKIWGFWSILGAEHGQPEDEHMRPWYYTWALLTRAFPPGCETLSVGETGRDRVRVAAARIADEGKYHLSFAVVNNSDKPEAVRVVVPQASELTTLGLYEYFDADNDNRVDAWPQVVDAQGRDIFPSVTETLRDVDLASGLLVKLPSKGVVILTTLESGAPLALKD
jgi:hypothetical protein